MSSYAISSYAIHLLDGQGAITASRTLLCQDDLEALSEGVKCAEAHAIEIWQGPRLVARVKPGNAPLDAADARSL